MQKSSWTENRFNAQEEKARTENQDFICVIEILHIEDDINHTKDPEFESFLRRYKIGS